ncbi:uncharacterized protein LOC125947332 isoform X2 [Dermacentor silvarum]|uniref:uncharacterized protein LOC125947332 isoform X1 n=1 Tax=Dermacentor silvarum TaxID=543639 RepID=UPI00210122F8|nr:uncharacterized protein LOC125947332 isoform X1 [Dermacentor silvarum]XP_049527770.1 uncharacterized protein LOC125947332 isoform X2 [Dermacentor silvarum]
MHSHSSTTAVCIELLFLIVAVEASRGPNELQRDVPDAFKTFQAFAHPIAAMGNDSDPVLECASARRAEIDPETQTATYVWSLAGEDGKGRQHIPFYNKPGDSPDVTLFTVGSKSGPVEVGRFRYTDYKNCAILEMSHFGDQCALWVAYEVRDYIPAVCVEQYFDICGEGVSVYYKKEACKDAYN